MDLVTGSSSITLMWMRRCDYVYAASCQMVIFTRGSAGVVTLEWFALFRSRNVGEPVGFNGQIDYDAPPFCMKVPPTLFK
jgi:hypothetical protein